MSALVPCSNCRRHLRRTESLCPFCTTPVASDAAALPSALSVATLGLKRAALFAVSLVTSACAADSIDSNVVPVYGAPIPPQAGSGGQENAVPVYGAPVPPEGGSGGAAGSAGTRSDAGDAAVSDDADAGDGDAGDSDAGDAGDSDGG
jgi:hypothetical protein